MCRVCWEDDIAGQFICSPASKQFTLVSAYILNSAVIEIIAGTIVVPLLCLYSTVKIQKRVTSYFSST